MFSRFIRPFLIAAFNKLNYKVNELKLQKYIKNKKNYKYMYRENITEYRWDFPFGGTLRWYSVRDEAMIMLNSNK